MQNKGFADLIGDNERWIQGTQCILRNEGNPIAENAAAFFGVETDEWMSLQPDAAASDRCLAREKPKYGKRSQRFSTARFTDNRDDFTWRHGQTHAFDHTARAGSSRKLNGQIADLQRRR